MDEGLAEIGEVSIPVDEGLAEIREGLVIGQPAVEIHLGLNSGDVLRL